MKEIKNGLLIFPILKDLNKADGIVVKNEGIRNGFLKNGVQLDVPEFNSQGIFNNGDTIFKFHSNRYLRVYQYNIKIWKTIANYAKSKEYDFIWFRVPMIIKPIANFIRTLKKQNPYVKIVLEYGAYPYENELTKARRLLYRVNRHNEKKAHANADFVITYNDQEYVDNLKNIPIDNGIDLDNIPISVIHTNISKQVNLVCVSSLKKWHAYERLIEGLHIYYMEKNITPVHFHIIGNGPEYGKLVQLVNDKKLKDYVQFHNFKTGIELNEIYNDKHISVGTLGFHRIGLHKSSSLKNREYFARGLPIVVSTTDNDMPADLPYVKYVPEGEEPIDIHKIIVFAREVYSQTGVNEAIRKYAEEHVSWKSKISIVLQYLEERN